MIATFGVLTVSMDTVRVTIAASWMRPAELPELQEWACITAGVWLANLLDLEVDVEEDIGEGPRSPLIRTPEWHEQAVCLTRDPRRQVDPYWFGVDDLAGSVLPTSAVRHARAHCSVCPVRVDCLQWAIEHDERFGIWAGTTGRQRAAIRRDLRAGVVTLREVFARYA